MKLSFVLVVILYADHTLPTEGRCTSGEIFPDTSDETCNKYFVCKKGQLVKQTCFRDFVYSKTTNTCVPPSSSYNDCQEFKRKMETTPAVKYTTRKTKRPHYVKDITESTTETIPAVKYTTRKTKRPHYVKDITESTTETIPAVKYTTRKTKRPHYVKAVEYITRTTKRPYVKEITKTTTRRTPAVKYTTRTTKRPYYLKEITKTTTRRTPAVEYTTRTTKRPYVKAEEYTTRTTKRPYPKVESATRTTKATSYQRCMDGETSPNTYDCKSYYVCSYNRLILVSCPMNYVYRKSAGKCMMSHSPYDSC